MHFAPYPPIPSIPCQPSAPKSHNPLFPPFFPSPQPTKPHPRTKPPQQPDGPESGLYSYKKSTLMTVTHIVGTTIGTLIPTAAISVLYYVHDMVARLGAILAFSAVFSLALAVFTKAKKVEIFAATAA